jgi:hypothetical protein
MQPTIRDPQIIYYGPHACENCGVMICKMGYQFGGASFDYPAEPIYPNTEWAVHVCDQEHVKSLPNQMPAPPLSDKP